MIISKKKKNGIWVYHVDKDMDDTKLKALLRHKLKTGQIKDIIKEDADVYTKDDKLLIRFRKNKLSKEKIDAFYDNVIKFAMMKTSTRGIASGSKQSIVGKNPQTMTNILGYFDTMSVRQKHKYKLSGKTLPKITTRETRFTSDYPEEYKRLIPLISEIDDNYKRYVPDKHAKQKQKANQTPFHIGNTAFTTVTTNVNYQTALHTDKGDDEDGFGNLVVIERGNYDGGETCFPQYGIGVDVRTGDVLFMDVHQPHANMPIKFGSADAKRLSIVCYLRKNIWLQTKGKTKKFMMDHVRIMNGVTKTVKVKKDKAGKGTRRAHKKT